MYTTRHYQQRMSQRGINLEMTELVLRYGEAVDRDAKQIVLGRKEACHTIEALKRELRTLLKIADKGGLTVVVQEDRLVTTYNGAPQKSVKA